MPLLQYLVKFCSMPVELVRELEKLWQANANPPDVFNFLTEHNGLDAAQQLAVLLEDQKHRWQTDFPFRTRVPEYGGRIALGAGSQAAPKSHLHHWSAIVRNA